MYVNDGDVPSLHSRGVLEERELFHGIPELTLTLPKIQKKKNWFRVLTLSFKCRQLHIVKDSQIQRIPAHTLTHHNMYTHLYMYVYSEIMKRNFEETKYNKNLWAAHALLVDHKQNHIINDGEGRLKALPQMAGMPICRP